MERIVTNLLDFQRFNQNAKLAGIIHDAENRYANAISDDDLEMVSAAGDSTVKDSDENEINKSVRVLKPIKNRTKFVT